MAGSDSESLQGSKGGGKQEGTGVETALCSRQGLTAEAQWKASSGQGPRARVQHRALNRQDLTANAHGGKGAADGFQRARSSNRDQA